MTGNFWEGQQIQFAANATDPDDANADLDRIGEGDLAAVVARRRGQDWPDAEEEAFKAPIRAQYETQGHPYFAGARLWDDGMVDPADARMTLALGLSAALNAPIERTRFGIFRM